MSMSKKDYELLAEAFRYRAATRRVLGKTYAHVRENEAMMLAIEVSNRLFMDNPRFDRSKFLAAADVR